MKRGHGASARQRQRCHRGGLDLPFLVWSGPPLPTRHYPRVFALMHSGGASPESFASLAAPSASSVVELSLAGCATGRSLVSPATREAALHTGRSATLGGWSYRQPFSPFPRVSPPCILVGFAWDWCVFCRVIDVSRRRALARCSRSWGLRTARDSFHLMCSRRVGRVGHPHPPRYTVLSACRRAIGYQRLQKPVWVPFVWHAGANLKRSEPAPRCPRLSPLVSLVHLADGSQGRITRDPRMWSLRAG